MRKDTPASVPPDWASIALADVQEWGDNPPKTDLSRLTKIYDGCLERVNAYFSTILSSSGRVSQFIAGRNLE
jgi:hypothetical protein